MEWFKMKTDLVLDEDFSDKQLLAIIKAKALIARAENLPTKKSMNKELSKPERDFVADLLDELLEGMQKDIDRVAKKRGYSKAKMQQLRECGNYW